MAAEVLGQRMGDQVGAPVEGIAQVGRRDGVVDDQGDAGFMGYVGDFLDVDDDAPRVGQIFTEDGFALGCQRFAKILRVGRIDEVALPAEINAFLPGDSMQILLNQILIYMFHLDDQK